MMRATPRLAMSCALVALIALPTRAAEWGLTLAPGGRSGCCYGLAADDAGVIITGQLAEPHAIAGRRLEPLGQADAFLARFDASGRGISSARLGSVGNDAVFDLFLAPDGFDIVGQIDGPTRLGETFLPVTGHRESFLARFESVDVCAWASLVPGSDDRAVRAVRRLPSGRAVVLGTRRRTFSSDAAEPYLATYSAAGEMISSRRVFGATVVALAVAPERIYLGGTAESVTRQGAPLPDAWPMLGALSEDGEPIWSWIPEPPSDASQVWGRVVAASADSLGCVVLGEIRGLVHVGEHRDASLRGRDAFLARIDAEGALVWLTRFGSGGDDDAFDLDLADDGSIWITGAIAAPASFGPWNTSNRSAAAYLASFDAEGQCMSVRLGVGPDDEPLAALPFQVAVTSDAVYVAGWFRRALNWGAWEISGGEDEQFLGRFDR